MANLATNRTISFDQDSRRLLRRLVEAQEEGNRLKKKQFELLRPAEVVFNQHIVTGDENGLDEKIQQESGVNLDRKLLEEAVAEGDDPEVLEHPRVVTKHMHNLRFAGIIPDLDVAEFISPSNDAVRYRMALSTFEAMDRPDKIQIAIEPGYLLD